MRETCTVDREEAHDDGAAVPLRFGPAGGRDRPPAPTARSIVRSPHELGPYPRAMTDRLDHWAATAPDRVFLAQRDATGKWCEITYAGARALARNIAQGLIDRGLSAERPVAILSGNGLEHALLGLGAMYAGVPYRLDLAGLFADRQRTSASCAAILDLLTPGLVFAIDGAQFARAIDGAVPADAELVVLEQPPASRAATPLEALWSTPADRRRRCRPRQGRPRYDRQAPVHLGLDRHAEGRDQHAAHADVQPGDDRGTRFRASPRRRRCWSTGCRGATRSAATTTSTSC